MVRYRGTGARKPMLLLAHIDVVEAMREDWTVDPFAARKGRLLLRARHDGRQGAGGRLGRNLMRYEAEGFRPDRDLIVALTADEEGGGPYNGVDWLLKNQRELIDAEFALNEGGRGELVDGKRVEQHIGLAEKKFVNLRLEVRNKGGHSARPGAGQRDLSSGGRAVPPRRSSSRSI